MKALILAAGYATRLDPLTETVAKPLLPLAGRPMLDYLLDRIHEVDEIDAVHVVTNHKFAQSFAEWARTRRRRRSRRRDDERGRPARRDRRHRVRRRARRLADDDLIVIAGDNLFDYSLGDCVRWWRDRGEASAVVLYDVGDLELVKRYSNVEVDADGRLVSFVEKPEHAASTLVATAVVSLPPPARAAHPALSRGGQPARPARPARRMARPAGTGLRLSGLRRAGSTSATPPSCSRRTTASAASRACPSGIRTPSTRVRPVASTELRAEDIRWNLTDLCEGAEEARAQWLVLVETRAGARVALPRQDRVARRRRLARPARRGRRARTGALAPAGLLVPAPQHGRDRRRGERPRDLLPRPRRGDREHARLPRPRMDRARRRPRRAAARRRRARAVRAQAAGRAGGEAVRPERAGGAGAERAPPDGLRLAGAARPARLDARGAVRRGRG